MLREEIGIVARRGSLRMVVLFPDDHPRFRMKKFDAYGSHARRSPGVAAAEVAPYARAVPER